MPSSDFAPVRDRPTAGLRAALARDPARALGTHDADVPARDTDPLLPGHRARRAVAP